MVRQLLRNAALASAIAFVLSATPAPANAGDVTQVTLVDQRSPESLQARRDSNFSAIAFLPEKAVKPGPIAQLQAGIAKLTSNPITIVVTEMRVIDYFPRRIKAGPAGWLNNAIMKSLVNSKTDWDSIDDLGVSNEQDSVLCLFVGTVNGKEVKLAASSPYKLGGLSMMVRSDKNFRAAVTYSIDQVAQKIVDQIASSQVSQ